MAIETSATQQSRRPRHNPENNNPTPVLKPTKEKVNIQIGQAVFEF
jgi:hypothetical protein